MPCIFCIAVIVIIAGVAAASTVDELETALQSEATGLVRRTADSDSVTRFELEVAPEQTGGKPTGGAGGVPVAVTFYKPHGRLRVQVLTHDLDRAAATRVIERVAAAAGAQVVSWSDPATEAKIREATAGAQPADPSALPPRLDQPRGW